MLAAGHGSNTISITTLCEIRVEAPPPVPRVSRARRDWPKGHEDTPVRSECGDGKDLIKF